MLHHPCARVAFPFAALLLSFTATAAEPHVRAITVFIDLDPSRYEQQIVDTSRRLRTAAAAFEEAGYTVQTVRITTQPFPAYVQGLQRDRALSLLYRIEELARKHDVLINIGPAALDDRPEASALELLEEVHANGKLLDATMIVAGETGVHWDTVRAAARHVYQVARRSPRSQGTFAFAATAMLAPGSPFFPGSWHSRDAGKFSVGLQSANVVAEVFSAPDLELAAASSRLTEALSAHALAVQRVAMTIEKRTGWKYWGLDPTPAPLKEVSIGAAMEALQRSKLGSSGTLTAAYVITDSLSRIPGARVGYSGLMLPVMEDARIAQRWSEGAIGLDSLLAYSAVCGTGLDTIPLPGDVTEAQLARIIGDVAVLAVRWKKPLTARLQPVFGKSAGQMSEFDDPFLLNVRLQPVR